MIKKILLTIVFIIAALWLYDYQSIPQNEFLFNRDLIFELSHRDNRHLGVKIYPDPSDRNNFIDSNIEFVVSLMNIFEKSHNMFEVLEKANKNVNFRDHQLLYVEINDYNSKEWCCAKLHASREGHLLLSLIHI